MDTVSDLLANPLAGKVVVVFGAAGGLGAGLSRRCAEAGARLVVVDLDVAVLDSTRRELVARGADVTAMTADVVDTTAIDAVRDAVVQEHGRVDFVLNTVGVTNFGAVWEQRLEDWRWIVEVNFWGALHVTRSFVPVLVEQGGGHIVHTASTTALAPGRGNCTPYMASKHALVALCEGLQQDLRARESAVRVSVFVPGTVRSSIAQSEQRRQAQFGAPGTSAEATAALQAHLDAHGIDGYDAAADLLDGLEHDRFYILARNVDPAIVEARAHAITSGVLPAP